MPKFTYTAIDSATGKDRKGVIEAPTTEQATIELKAKGLLPTQIMGEGNASNLRLGAKKMTRGGGGGGTDVKSWLNLGATGTKKKKPISFGKPINQKGLTLFTRQLATLINAGMPILRSLETLARQEKRPAFKAAVEEIAETIRSGGTFSDGLLQHPKIFDRLYVNMVKAGEAGGVLGVVLDRLSKFMEKAMKIRGKVKSAMTYPLIIMFVAVGVVAALMVFVIPKFEEIFDGLLKGKPLPDITRLVLGVSRFIKDHFLITLGIVIGLWILFKVFKKTKTGTSIIDKFLIKVPALGPLFLKAAVGRFTRTLGTLLTSGVPILQALLITRDTSGNVHVANALNQVHDRVKEGDSVGKPLEATRVFPTMVSSMVEVGEETGALSDMLNRIADVYDDEVDNAVASITSIIEPVMIVFLAVIVGTIVIAMFMPLIRIIQELSN
jgi:type IV pilus assembly protein PilC